MSRLDGMRSAFLGLAGLLSAAQGGALSSLAGTGPDLESAAVGVQVVASLERELGPAELSQQGTRIAQLIHGAWSCVSPADRAIDGGLDSQSPKQLTLDNSLLLFTTMGEIGCVKKLLDFGADVNAYRVPLANDFGDGPPLHTAISQEKYAIAVLLLQQGADPNLPCAYGGKTALQLTFGSNAPQGLIDLLNNKGAH